MSAVSQHRPDGGSALESDWISDLLTPSAELIETHISWVILDGSDVWKIKKPVDLGFLDFSTIQLRKSACEAEVRLNRRLAPGIYRGIVPVTRDSTGRHVIGGEGEAVDWAVHMKRLPLADRLDSRLNEGRLTREHLTMVADRLARFHAGTRSDEETALYGGLETVSRNVRENFEQTRVSLPHYLGPEAARELESWQLDFLRRRAARFEARARDGKVRDGHGDLRLEHVYLRTEPEEPDREPVYGSGAIVIVDCIEFNRRFRFADVSAEVAFLAMDLTWHAEPELAEHFLAAYASAADDFGLYPVVDFYESYRAFVRGKISALVASDPEQSATARRRADKEARKYFVLALASERRRLLPPRLIAVGGVIASGKSTVARGLSDALAAPVIDADRTRKRWLGVAPRQPVHEAPWTGAYSPAASREVYRRLFARADAVLSSGRTAILDASFRSREERRRAAALAERHGVPFHFIECRASSQLCRDRLVRRQREGGVSDGRLEIFDDFVARWERVVELQPEQHTIANTSKPLETTLEGLRDELGGWPPPRTSGEAPP